MSEQGDQEPDYVPTKKEAYDSLHMILGAKPASHRNADDWLAIARAEDMCGVAETVEYLQRVRKK